MRASAELRDISIFSEDSIVYGEMSHRSKWYAVCALFTLATMTQVGPKYLLHGVQSMTIIFNSLMTSYNNLKHLVYKLPNTLHVDMLHLLSSFIFLYINTKNYTFLKNK